MPLTRSGVEIWRKYQTDGVPSTGLHQPDQDEIQIWARELEALIAASTPNIITGPGTITLTFSDLFNIVDRAVPEAANINLPSVATALGPFEFKDGALNFDAFPQTLVPNGTDTIMGMTSMLLDAKGQSIKLYPYVRAGADVWLP